jgi:hypothetical protein
MLYLGPNYPKKLRLFVIPNFLPLVIRALQWVPINFFPKIPEIDLRRSLQFSLGVIVAIAQWAKSRFFRHSFKYLMTELIVQNIQILSKTDPTFMIQ